MANDDRLNLFEGIIIGIYGNWLISLIDKISFTMPLIIAGHSLFWFQPVLFILSITCLIALVAIGVFGGKLETRWEVVILGMGHFIPICASFYVEELILKDYFFFSVGGILFLIIYTTEFSRARQIKRINDRR
ncbi:hypothetical protein [[Eubacterium] cellulosolvens]